MEHARTPHAHRLSSMQIAMNAELVQYIQYTEYSVYSYRVKRACAVCFIRKPIRAS
jgi:hypothetical protein